MQAPTVRMHVVVIVADVTEVATIIEYAQFDGTIAEDVGAHE
jgi:hypothetical protein